MSWKKNKFYKRVTIRLTFWYLVVFSLLLIGVYLTLHAAVTALLKKRMDQFIHTKYAQLSWIDGMFEENPKWINKALAKITNNFYYHVDVEKNYHLYVVMINSNLELITSSTLTLPQENTLTPAEVPRFIIHSDSIYLNTTDQFEEDGISYEIEKGLITAYKTYPNLDESGSWRVGYRRLADGNILIIGASLYKDAQFLSTYSTFFGLALILMLVVGGSLGFLIIKRSMRGVERVTLAASQIDQDDLTVRVAIGKEGLEIEELALAFNSMLERIQAVVSELTEISHNIAHDLRSPITRMRGIAETTLNQQECGKLCSEMCGAIIEECDRLINMVNTILDIAEADAGAAKFKLQRIALNDLIAKAVDLFLPVAEDRALSLMTEGLDESVYVMADPPRLQRAVANILDNAIKYNQSGTEIQVSLTPKNNQIEISIQDQGMGIEANDLPHIFERFYRGDKSRSTSGNGLGLSLARSIIAAHNGTIHVESMPDKGSTFTMSLPVAVT